MSIKAVKFQEMIGNPMNTFNFKVLIQSKFISKVQIMVASTSFPNQQLQDFVLWFQGERVKFPSIPTNSGQWSCTMPEGEYQKVTEALQGHMQAQYNNETGALTYWASIDKFDIEVYPCQLRDVDMANPLYGVRLKGCYFKGTEDVSLDNSNPTGNWVYTLQFSYDYLETIKPAAIDTTPAGVKQ